MPKIPLYFLTRSTLVKPWVKGYAGNARNKHHVKWFWIDQNWQHYPSNEPAFPSYEFPPPAMTRTRDDAWESARPSQSGTADRNGHPSR
jgi:hypothetical protein